MGIRSGHAAARDDYRCSQDGAGERAISARIGFMNAALGPTSLALFQLITHHLSLIADIYR